MYRADGNLWGSSLEPHKGNRSMMLDYPKCTRGQKCPVAGFPFKVLRLQPAVSAGQKVSNLGGHKNNWWYESKLNIKIIK
jgi:hypothetical protein